MERRTNDEEETREDENEEQITQVCKRGDFENGISSYFDRELFMNG